MYLTLVRHGETDHNAAGRLQGWADISLNSTGKRQARAVARRLAADLHAEYPPLTALHSSDLGRARQTAQAIAEACAVPVIPTPALREIGVGHWEGRTFAELQAEDLGRFSGWPLQAAPGGESAAEVARRVRDYLSGLEASPQAHIALVTHGVVITALLAELLGWNLAEAWAEHRGVRGPLARVIQAFLLR